jgi:hypothetical protein
MKRKTFISLLLLLIFAAFTIVVRAEKPSHIRERQSLTSTQVEQIPSLMWLSLVHDFFPPAREEAYLLLVGGVFSLLGIVSRKTRRA